MLRSLPSTGAVSGILEAVGFFRDPNFASRRFETYGDVFETTLIGQRLVFVRGDEAIEDLFQQSDAVQGWWPSSVRTLLGSRSLANRNGPAHKARRRVVGQLFAAAALRRYSPQIIAMVNNLADEVASTKSPIALADRMRRFAFSVIATTVLGLDGSDRDALFVDFEIWTKALFSLPVAIPGSPFAKALQARARLLSKLQQVLADADGRRGGLDLLAGGLDEAGLPLSDEDLVEQLLLLLFAGYETTASSLSCLMRKLLLQPELLLWLQEELNGLVWPPSDDPANSYDPGKAPRLQAVVNEVMRMTPPVGGFFRITTRPIALAGVEIPEGRVIQVALASSNRHGAGDLEKFRPQRHLDGSLQKSLLPFGGGERVCLGKALAELEIRLMTVGLLKQVSFSLCSDQDLDLQLIPSPSPKGGLLVSARD
ncbi:MAG: cytochrome P450 [Synechococcus sp. TMED20]|nr:MAG: cytochrome P450 [Synechococcus sp. TMED20]